MAGLMWGADGPNRIYGQDVSGLGVGWGQNDGGSNFDPRIGMNTFALGQTPGQYQALGFNGDVMTPAPYDPNQNADTIGGQVVNPAFLQWLQQKQYTPVSASDQSGQHGALQDAQGNIVNGSQRQWGDGSDDAFGLAALLAGGVVGGVAAGVGAGTVGTGAAVGTGAGATNAALIDSYLGTAGYGASSAGVGGGAAGIGGVASYAADGTTPVEYQPYNGPGSQGYQVAGDNAVAPSTADTANIGSDAHFYNNPTAQEGGLGNMGGAGSQSLPFYQTSPADSSSNWLTKLLTPQNGQTAAGLLGAGSSGSSGSSGSVGAALAAALAGGVNAGNAGSVGTPNYQGAATSMGQSARTNQNGPLGSVNYVQTGVDAQGNPIYSQNTSLSGAQQQNLTAAQGAQGQALGALGQDQSAAIQQAQDAAYHKQTALLDPQYQQGQQALDSSLANQGIGIGSEAYNNATGNFARQKDYAYGNARDSSIAQGNAMQQQLYGQNYQTATGLGSTINSMGNPQFQTPPTSTNYLGAAALQGQGNLNQYNATTGANNSFTNGLFNLGGSVLSNPNWTGLIGNFFSNNGNSPAPQTGP